MIYSRSSSPEYLLLVSFFFFLSWWWRGFSFFFRHHSTYYALCVSDIQNGRHILCILFRRRTKRRTADRPADRPLLESITSIIKAFFSFHSFFFLSFFRSCTIIAPVSRFSFVVVIWIGNDCPLPFGPAIFNEFAIFLGIESFHTEQRIFTVSLL